MEANVTMPSLLSCFCVRHHRHNFVKPKRESRKKILHRTSDLNSESGSELYVSPEEINYPNTHSLQNRKKNEDEEIMNRLLANQQAPRRRHVEDIFRQESPEVKSLGRKLQRYSPPNRSNSEDTMYGYVPRAVGAMSASTALTGEKFDDFFSDCRMNPALDKFAKSSNVHGHSLNMFQSNLHTEHSSIVQLDIRENIFTETPHHVQIELSDENPRFDDVMRGSVSSASPSPIPSEEFVSTPDSYQHSFLDQDEPEYNSTYPEDPLGSRYNSVYVQDPVGSTDRTAYPRGLENMFHRDGDVLY